MKLQRVPQEGKNGSGGREGGQQSTRDMGGERGGRLKGVSGYREKSQQKQALQMM